MITRGGRIISATPTERARASAREARHRAEAKYWGKWGEGTPLERSREYTRKALRAQKRGARRARKAQKKYTRRGIESIRGGTRRGVKSIRRGVKKATKELRPWQEAGTWALGELKGLLTDPESFKESPGYKWRLEQGTAALERGAAAEGKQLSGQQLAELQEYGQGLAAQEYQNVFNRYRNIAGMGQQASTQIGQWQTRAGRDIGQLRARAGRDIGGLQRGLGEEIAKSHLYAGRAGATAYRAMGQNELYANQLSGFGRGRFGKSEGVGGGGGGYLTSVTEEPPGLWERTQARENLIETIMEGRDRGGGGSWYGHAGDYTTGPGFAVGRKPGGSKLKRRSSYTGIVPSGFGGVGSSSSPSYRSHKFGF